MRNHPAAALGLLIALPASLAACSLDVPKDPNGSGGHGLTINIERNQPPQLSHELFDLTDALLLGAGTGHGGFHIFTGPSTLSDFNCYAVNITGPGVVSNGATQLQNCQTPNNMHGTGIGFVTNTFAPGTAVSVLVPSNSPLTIDAYGVYPSSGCGNGGGNNNNNNNNGGGGGGGYFLGRAMQTLTQDASVTISASYSGAGADITCTGGGTGGFNIQQVYPYGGCNTGGTAITISGNGFQPGAAVTIGGTACNSVTVVNSSTITCTTAGGAAGNTTLVVTNPDGTTTSQQFYYTTGSYVTNTPYPPSGTFQMGTVTVGNSVTQTITFTSTGCATSSEVGSDPLPAANSEFSTTGGTCSFGGTLTTPNSCTFIVTFAPTATGSATASNVSFWTGGGSMLTFTGTGQ